MLQINTWAINERTISWLKHLLHENINTSMDQNITPGFDIGHFTNIKACIFFSQ